MAVNVKEKFSEDCINRWGFAPEKEQRGFIKPSCVELLKYAVTLNFTTESQMTPTKIHLR